jgi:hypothetical protein
LRAGDNRLLRISDDAVDAALLRQDRSGDE